MKIVCAGIVFFAILATAVAQPPSSTPEAPTRPRRGGLASDEFSRHVTAPQLERATSGRKLNIEIVLAETDHDIDQPTAAKILELLKAGKLSGVARVRLAALEELPTFAKFSEIVPRVVGHSSTSAGTRITPIYNDTNIGTTVQATLRMIESGEAIMQIFVERSRLGKQKGTDAATSELSKVETLSAQSTTRTKMGEHVLLSAGPLSGEGTTHGWVIVTITEQ